MDLAAAREDPIPVYAEMESVNPVFILPRALREQGESLAAGLHASFTLGGGQFCTKPGLVFLDLPEVLVNLSAGNNTERTQYLKVKVTLELPNEATSAQVQPLMPRLMDAFQTYLRELRPSDLDGSAGLYRLKEELTRRVNAAIAPSRINAVLFKEIVVQ